CRASACARVRFLLLRADPDTVCQSVNRSEGVDLAHRFERCFAHWRNGFAPAPEHLDNSATPDPIHGPGSVSRRW
ncbi:MAG: hypothetical protein ACK55Z_11550, partial [bacterium]